MRQGRKPLNMPSGEAKVIQKNRKFLQFAVLHLSASQHFRLGLIQRSYDEMQVAAVERGKDGLIFLELNFELTK